MQHLNNEQQHVFGKVFRSPSTLELFRAALGILKLESTKGGEFENACVSRMERLEILANGPLVTKQAMVALVNRAKDVILSRMILFEMTKQVAK